MAMSMTSCSSRVQVAVPMMPGSCEVCFSSLDAAPEGLHNFINVRIVPNRSSIFLALQSSSAANVHR